MNRREKLAEAIERGESIPVSYGRLRSPARRIRPLEIRGPLLVAEQTMGFSKSGDRRGLKTFKLSKLHLKEKP